MTRLQDGLPVELVDVVEGLDGCHSANITPDNRTLWVPALKQDRICLFTLSDDGHLVAREPAEVNTVEGQARVIWSSTRIDNMRIASMN